MWLVKNHLVMSDVAQKRDISDPKTVKDFSCAGAIARDAAVAAGLLTVADIAAA